jgi:hypothetical protein
MPSRAALKDECIDTLRQAAAVIDAKAPGDAAAFKGWLRQMGRRGERSRESDPRRDLKRAQATRRVNNARLPPARACCRASSRGRPAAWASLDHLVRRGRAATAALRAQGLWRSAGRGGCRCSRGVRELYPKNARRARKVEPGHSRPRAISPCDNDHTLANEKALASILSGGWM